MKKFGIFTLTGMNLGTVTAETEKEARKLVVEHNDPFHFPAFILREFENVK